MRCTFFLILEENIQCGYVFGSDSHDRIMWVQRGVSFHVFIYIYDFLFCFSVYQSSSEKGCTLKRNNSFQGEQILSF